MGLSQVAQAVAFLNNDCKMVRVLHSAPCEKHPRADRGCAQVHGNVCLSSVVVTESLDWRLHSFDLMSEWSAERPPEALMSHAFMLPEQYKPEEVRKGAWEALRDAPPWCAPAATAALLLRLCADARACTRAVDAWGMGCLVQEIFAGHKLARTEELRELAHVPTVRKPGSRCAARAGA